MCQVRMPDDFASDRSGKQETQVVKVIVVG